MSQLQSGVARRRTKRVSTSLMVVWHRRGGDVDAVATDINADGLFLLTDEVIDPGALMELRMMLPGGMLQVLATARFVGRTQVGNGIGVELFMLPAHARRRWLAYYRGLLAELERPAAPVEDLLGEPSPA
jgi:hypothetical protein